VSIALRTRSASGFHLGDEVCRAHDKLDYGSFRLISILQRRGRGGAKRRDGHRIDRLPASPLALSLVPLFSRRFV
jgi:hypothetical protein